MSDCLADIDVAILCGGKGTRLKPIIGDLPKVLAPIKGRPFIEWHIDYLRQFGVRRILLIAGHGHDRISRWLANYPADNIELYVDSECAGAGNALYFTRHAQRTVTMLVTNGDTLLKGDLESVIPNMRAHCPSVLTVGGRSTGMFTINSTMIEHRIFLALPMEALFAFDFLDIGTPEGYAQADAFLG